MEESSFVSRSWEWFRARAHSTHAKVWLAILSYTEAFVSLILPDPLLALMAGAVPHKWWRLTVLATTAATLGAITGYLIGMFVFDSVGAKLIAFYSLESEVEYASALLERSLFLATVVVAFTPLPDKLFVILAGFLGLNPVVMTIAFILGRGARFGLVGYVSAWYGERALLLLFRYMKNPFVRIGAALALVLVLLIYTLF